MKEFLDIMNSGVLIPAGSPIHEKMHALSQEAIRITLQLNNSYHTHEEIISLMSELTGERVHESFNVFPPFNTGLGPEI